MSDDAKKSDVDIDVSSSSGGGTASKLGPILAILNLVLTLGIGGVVFLQFQKDKNKESVADIQAEAPAGEHGAPAGEHGAKKEEAPAGEHGAKKEEAKSEHGAPAGEHGAKSEASGAQTVNLEQFTVNLSTSVGTPPRFARVMIAVEVPSGDTASELNQKMAQVRNAVIDLFNSKRPADLQTGEGRNFLKEEIRNALNSFLVTGKVKGVFFSNFQVSS